MTVADLLKTLEELPPDAKVCYVWDGDVRSEVERVWISRKREVILSHDGEPVYTTENRPESAPTEEEDPYWEPS